MRRINERGGDNDFYIDHCEICEVQRLGGAGLTHGLCDKCYLAACEMELGDISPEDLIEVTEEEAELFCDKFKHKMI